MSLYNPAEDNPTDPSVEAASIPTEPLTLLRVVVPDLQTPDILMQGVVFLVFDRPVTWWESNAARDLEITVDPGQSRGYTKNVDLRSREQSALLNSWMDQIRTKAERTMSKSADLHAKLRQHANETNDKIKAAES